MVIPVPLLSTVLDGFNVFYCTVTTFKYVEGGPDREASEVVWNTNLYI